MNIISTARYPSNLVLRHSSVDLFYATIADLKAGVNELNGVVLSSSNIYQVAIVLEDKSTWLMMQLTPVLVWNRYDASTFQETTEDKTLYINPTTGSDSNDGSAAYPFATWDRALQLPFVIKHRIRIKPAAGTYSSFPSSIYHLFLDYGCLILDASDVSPTVISSHTVDTLDPRGEFFTNYGVAAHMTVAGSPGWSTDEIYGKWIHPKDGSANNKYFPVYYNSSDLVKLPYIGLVTGAFTTFDVVEAPIIINVDHEIMFKGFSNFLWNEGGNASNAPAFPSLWMAGIRFNVTPKLRSYHFGPYYNSAVTTEGLNSIISFCTFNKTTPDDPYSSPFYVSGGSCNFITTPTDQLFDNQILDGNRYVNLLSNNGIAATDSSNKYLQIASGSVQNICARGGIYNYMSNMSAITNCCSGYFRWYGCRAGFMGSCCVDAIGFSSDGISLDGVDLHGNWFWIENASRALVLTRGAYFESDWVQGNTITSAYAAVLNSVSHIIKKGGANFNVVGTTGAIEFQFGGTTQATWPTAGTPYINGDNSSVIGVA